MSRETKYRVWDKQNQCWSMDEIYIDSDGDLYEIYEASRAYQTYMHKERVNERYEVVWYTGLRDKNGTEIYEGDIVLVDNGRYQGEVRWNDQDLSFVIENHDGGFGFVNGQIFDERPEYRTYEVIGNIYENADLMQREGE